MNNSVWASGLKIIITIRIIMFILLFIVLRHQYLCSAVWTVCSYTSNASSATSNIAEPLSLCVCVCFRLSQGLVLVCVWRKSYISENSPPYWCRTGLDVAVYILYCRSKCGWITNPEDVWFGPSTATMTLKNGVFSFPAEISETIILSLADQ